MPASHPRARTHRQMPLPSAQPSAFACTIVHDRSPLSRRGITWPPFHKPWPTQITKIVKKHDKNVVRGGAEELQRKEAIRQVVKSKGFFSDGLLAKVCGDPRHHQASQRLNHSTAKPGLTCRTRCVWPADVGGSEGGVSCRSRPTSTSCSWARSRRYTAPRSSPSPRR